MGIPNIQGGKDVYLVPVKVFWVKFYYSEIYQFLGSQQLEYWESM